MIYTTEIIDFIEKHNLLPILNESPFYKLNNKLRRKNVKFDLTDDEKNKLQEIKTTNILPCKIKLENGDYGNFCLRNYQIEIINNMKSDRFMFVNNSSQMGISTSLSVHLLKEYGLSNSESKNQTILLVSNVLMIGDELINKIKNMYETLPFFMKSGIVRWNKKSIEFENGNQIIICGKNTPQFNVNVLIIFDCKYFQKIEKFYNNILPTTISKNSKIFIFESGNLDKNNFLRKLLYSHKS